MASAAVVVRHSKGCPFKTKSAENPLPMKYQHCGCLKSIIVYENGAERWKSTGETSWSKAEEFARNYLKSLEPDQIELKRLRAVKDTLAVALEDAISMYTQDAITRLGDASSVRNIRSLFGTIDPKTKGIVRPGHFFTWVHKQIPRPQFISDITTQQLSAWRNTWEFGSDYTAFQYWQGVGAFFAFAVSRGWLAENPARRLKALTVDKAGRGCAIFTDEQYQNILEACGDDQGLETFTELMRHGGMDLIDAVQFRPAEQVRGDVLRYRRVKTGQSAAVPLPPHVLALLRSIPLKWNSVGAAMPFRTKGRSVAADIRKYHHRFTALFKKAKIESVVTAQGRVRKPFPKAFRHTCAVSHLIHGASLVAVASFLGHADPSTTAKYYLGFVPELENAVLAEGRKSMAAALPKPRGGVVNISGTR
jgi:integrase